MVVLKVKQLGLGNWSENCEGEIVRTTDWPSYLHFLPENFARKLKLWEKMRWRSAGVNEKTLRKTGSGWIESNAEVQSHGHNEEKHKMAETGKKMDESGEVERRETMWEKSMGGRKETE